MTDTVNERQRAYAMLRQRKTISEIATALNASRTEVMGWIADQCAENQRSGYHKFATDYADQAGRKKFKIKPEAAERGQV